jgi:hypothetical protein
VFGLEVEVQRQTLAKFITPTTTKKHIVYTLHKIATPRQRNVAPQGATSANILPDKYTSMNS